MKRQRIYPGASLAVIEVVATFARDPRASIYKRPTPMPGEEPNATRALVDRYLGDDTLPPIVVGHRSQAMVSVELRQQGACCAGLTFVVRGAAAHKPSPMVEDCQRASFTHLRRDLESIPELRFRLLLAQSDPPDREARRVPQFESLDVMPQDHLRMNLDTHGQRRNLMVTSALGHDVAGVEVSAWSVVEPWARPFTKTLRADVSVGATRIHVYDFGARAESMPQPGRSQGAPVGHASV